MRQLEEDNEQMQQEIRNLRVIQNEYADLKGKQLLQAMKTQKIQLIAEVKQSNEE